MSRVTLVTLTSGITVPKRGVWLHESCPKADEHSPFPKDFNGVRSMTHRQAIHPWCGLWSLWVRRRVEPQEKPR